MLWRVKHELLLTCIGLTHYCHLKVHLPASVSNKWQWKTYNFVRFSRRIWLLTRRTFDTTDIWHDGYLTRQLLDAMTRHMFDATIIGRDGSFTLRQLEVTDIWRDGRLMRRDFMRRWFSRDRSEYWCLCEAPETSHSVISSECGEQRKLMECWQHMFGI